MLYHYWLLRYVPDTARPDTVGVGVAVIGQNPTDIAIRVVTRYDEIPDIGGPRKEFAVILRDIEKEFVSYTLQQESFAISYTSSAKTYIERLRRQNYGILQIDRPAHAAGESAQWVCNFLFERLVTRKQSQNRGPQRVTELRKEAQQQYRQHSEIIAKRLIERPYVRVRKGSPKIDLAVFSDSYQEINRAFSFAVTPSTEVRDRGIAFAHNIGKLRADGAKLEKGGKIHQLDSERTTVLAVIEYPQDRDQSEVFEEATADWEDLGIKMIDPSMLPSHLHQVELKLVA